MTIREVIVSDDKIRIVGDNLYQKSRLFINDIQHEFVFENDEHLVVNDVDLSKFEGKINIKLQLYNTIEKVVAESNEFRKDILALEKE